MEKDHHLDRKVPPGHQNGSFVVKLEMVHFSSLDFVKERCCLMVRWGQLPWSAGGHLDKSVVRTQSLQRYIERERQLKRQGRNVSGSAGAAGHLCLVSRYSLAEPPVHCVSQAEGNTRGHVFQQGETNMYVLCSSRNEFLFLKPELSSPIRCGKTTEVTQLSGNNLFLFSNCVEEPFPSILELEVHGVVLSTGKEICAPRNCSNGKAITLACQILSSVVKRCVAILTEELRVRMDQLCFSSVGQRDLCCKLAIGVRSQRLQERPPPAILH